MTGLHDSFLTDLCTSLSHTPNTFSFWQETRERGRERVSLTSLTPCNPQIGFLSKSMGTPNVLSQAQQNTHSMNFHIDRSFRLPPGEFPVLPILVTTCHSGPICQFHHGRISILHWSHWRFGRKHPAKQPSMNAGKIFWQLKINSLTIMINSCYPLSICGNSKPKEFQSLIKHNWGPWWSTNRPGIFQSSCAPAKHGTCQVGKSIGAAIPASSNDLWGYCYTMWENWASLSWLYPS